MIEAERLVRSGAVAEGADGRLWVVIGPERGVAEPAHCSAACAAGCGACPDAVRPRRIALEGLAGAVEPLRVARPGDRVEFSVDARGLARAAGWTFGIPLGGLLAGAWMGSGAVGEGASIACGIVGLCAGLAWLLGRGGDLVVLLGLRVDRPADGLTASNGCPVATGASGCRSEV